MTAMLNTVRNKFNQCTFVNRLRKVGCRISLNGAPSPRLIVDFDKKGSPLNKNQTRCDYLYFAESAGKFTWVVPLELKRGCLDVSKAVEQLKAGTRVAEQYVSANEPVKFRPVAAAKSVPKARRDKLKEKGSRIRFHGRTEAIRFMTCGAQLRDVLK